MIKKFGRIVLISALAGTLVVTPVFAAPSIDDIQASKNAAEQQVSSLQSQLQDLMTKSMQLESDLIVKGTEVQQAEADLAAAQAKEEQQYQDMKKRIRYMYEEGDTSFVEALLESKSISELLNKAEYVTNVHNYDRNQLEEYTKTKKEVENLKNQLEEEQANMQDLMNQYEAQKQETNTLLEEKQDEVANLSEELQAAIEQAAAAQRAKEAEEAARAASEAQNQMNSQNNNGGTEEVTNGGSQNNSGNSGHNGNSNSNAAVETPSDSGSSSSGGSGNTSAAQAIVNAAYSQLGVPYVWGGTSPGSGLDCSGLTQYAHRAAGISIPRTSGPQGAGGKSVSNPLPGDIVCYSGHVGIYIGGGQMIHAPQPGDVVKVASVYGSPWYRRYW